MIDFLGSLICRWKGHKRGRRVSADQQQVTFRCTRCSATWTRPVRKVAG